MHVYLNDPSRSALMSFCFFLALVYLIPCFIILAYIVFPDYEIYHTLVFMIYFTCIEDPSGIASLPLQGRDKAETPIVG